MVRNPEAYSGRLDRSNEHLSIGLRTVVGFVAWGLLQGTLCARVVLISMYTVRSARRGSEGRFRPSVVCAEIVRPFSRSIVIQEPARI